ncbi:hypothetical protein [Rickettsiales endosymbiont of Peranema trichophorum]|uniref:hypothetical protein n=1 Tax=Rickettsiales endosymbiont of Peranema trichophorum TaxID=2486577 RepID=UPI0013EE89B7|nr:hypothetical protein [Rickettsiales endosymbiont of Peranema trichophorum]
MVQRDGSVEKGGHTKTGASLLRYKKLWNGGIDAVNYGLNYRNEDLANWEW